MRIECNLGEMQLEVESDDPDQAADIFQQIWKERVAEKQRAEAFSSRNLEKQEWFDSMFG
jgi:hypothetical protein